MGRPRAAPLLPILRSEAQGKILAALFVAPSEDPVHIRALADRTGLPFSTVQREIARLEQAGLVTSQRFAQARVVRANESSPLADDLRALLMKTYGPVQVLEDVLREVQGIEDAYLFGSWAARYVGEPGPEPGDVDVVVVGMPDIDRIHEACADAEDRLGRPVQATVLSPDEWSADQSGFLKTIKARPLVRLEVPRK